ncbi:hypothetical protein HYDPIDRAFT_128161 [Hydnomerulius pinastri MD-312]|nr:hypothetical protein HYDPIDRAFT_128161 [Hydnomerulius pinastri MD-312]
MSTSPKVWFVTGASSGFGRSMTELALSKGDKVVATVRKPEILNDLVVAHPKDKLLVLQVDVCKPSDINAAFARIKETFGRIDVVFNNAGKAAFAEAEGMPDDVSRGMFEVNFWGAANVTRAAVKFLREVNPPGQGGVIFQISSVVAYHSLPTFSYYAARSEPHYQIYLASALEGFSEVFAKELPPEWNIKICIVEPGAFRTKGLDNATIVKQHSAYADESTEVSQVRRFLSDAKFIGDSNKFVGVMYKLAESNDIPLHLPMGQDAVKAMQSRGQYISDVAEKTAPWSEDVALEEGGVGAPI